MPAARVRPHFIHPEAERLCRALLDTPDPDMRLVLADACEEAGKCLAAEDLRREADGLFCIFNLNAFDPRSTPGFFDLCFTWQDGEKRPGIALAETNIVPCCLNCYAYHPDRFDRFCDGYRWLCQLCFYLAPVWTPGH